MNRKLKFANADDIIENCNVVDGCFTWKHKHGLSINNPCFAPLSPIALALQTTTVVRALFIACRFIPASGRLVKWCNTEGCVNPYHHSESRKVVKQRLQMGERDGQGFYTDLLPEQEAIRHLLPSPKILQQVAPTRPATVKLLMTSAMQAGYDCQNLPISKLQQKLSNAHRLKQPDGEPLAPVLVMKNYKPPKPAEQNPITDKEVDDFFNQDFFAAIQARKKAKLQKLVDKWDDDAK
jgi:hypothetical protein